MTTKLILALFAAFTLAGCGSLGCAGSAHNNAEGGGCSAHISF